MPPPVRVSVSIVSHGQMTLIESLLRDIARHCGVLFEVILTLNVPETPSFDTQTLGFPMTVLRNPTPKGFGANHNAAFAIARGDFFCVLNPDIRLDTDPFPSMLSTLSDPRIGVSAPLVLNPQGVMEDSARKFPTLFSLARRIVCNWRTPDHIVAKPIVFVDWVAGMFMIFRTEVYREIGGFDEAYFLYYEDVDLCWRLGCHGYRVVMVPATHVIHAARRASHRNPRYLRWHLASMLRFFWKRAVRAG